MQINAHGHSKNKIKSSKDESQLFIEVFSEYFFLGIVKYWKMKIKEIASAREYVHYSFINPKEGGSHETGQKWP